MDTTLSGLLSSASGVRDGLTTPESGGFLDTSNDERPGCSFRRFTSEHKEKAETEGFRTDVFTRINSQDGLIPNDIFILHLVI